MAPRDRAVQGDERVASLVSKKDGKQDAPSFTLAEVAKHGSAEDCWLIIHGKVYDVTKWRVGALAAALAAHAGGD